MTLNKIGFLPTLALATSLSVGCEREDVKQTRDLVSFLTSDPQDCTFKPIHAQQDGDRFSHVTLPDRTQAEYSTHPADKDPAILIEYQENNEIVSFSFFDQSPPDYTVCVDQGLDGVDFCSNAFSGEKISFRDDGKIDQIMERMHWRGRVSSAINHALDRASKCNKKS